MVYNNFPWPGGGEVEGLKSGEVEKCVGVVGRGVLGAPSGVVGSRDRGRRAEDVAPYQNPVNPVENDSPRSPDLHGKIASTAQSILDARSRYPGSSLADLYDPLTMPPDLRAAHAANDRAVLAAYGLAPDTPEPEIVAHLFRLYAEKVEKLKG